MFINFNTSIELITPYNSKLHLILIFFWSANAKFSTHIALLDCRYLALIVKMCEKEKKKE